MLSSKQEHFQKNLQVIYFYQKHYRSNATMAAGKYTNWQT